jgi:hypothetical protein
MSRLADLVGRSDWIWSPRVTAIRKLAPPRCTRPNTAFVQILSRLGTPSDSRPLEPYPDFQARTGVAVGDLTCSIISMMRKYRHSSRLAPVRPVPRFYWRRQHFNESSAHVAFLEHNRRQRLAAAKRVLPNIKAEDDLLAASPGTNLGRVRFAKSPFPCEPREFASCHPSIGPTSPHPKSPG